MEIVVNDEIVLKSVQLEYAVEVYLLVDSSRTTLRKWLPWVDNSTGPKVVGNFFKSVEKRLQAKNGFELAIFYKGKITGLIGVPDIDHFNNVTSIGYWLGNEYSGFGLMSKSVESLCAYCFSELKIRRIEIMCSPNNVKSQNIPKRLGFTYEGLLREKAFINGEPQDYQIFSLLKSDLES
jgi:ribosomal-protein-serine acetyltransferase